jgi:hypothetical protein
VSAATSHPHALSSHRHEDDLRAPGCWITALILLAALVALTVLALGWCKQGPEPQPIFPPTPIGKQAP